MSATRHTKRIPATTCTLMIRHKDLKIEKAWGVASWDRLRIVWGEEFVRCQRA